MATIDDLLRTLHRQAAALGHTGDPTRQLQAHLRAWAPLATHAQRVLEALDPRPEDRELYGLLRDLGRAADSPTGRPDARLGRVALTVGGLGDAIMGFPEAVAQAGQAQRSKLQASIQAALHAASRTTWDIAAAAGNDQIATLARRVAEATEPAALLPPSARVSTLERLTVTRLTPDTVDGAVQLWAGAAQRTFANYRIVTGTALQDAAATLALLCQITCGTLPEAARRHIIDPDAARNAERVMARAAAAWRRAAAWPTSVQLGGRAAEHHQATRAVREALTGPPLARLTLRAQVHTLHSAVHIAVAIGEAQASCVTRVARHGGLWIAHERPNLRPPGVERRHVKLDWEPLDHDHPAGVTLTGWSRYAQQALLAAANTLDRAVHPDPTPTGSVAPIALVEDRVVVQWWETVEPTARTRQPEDETTPLAVQHRPDVAR